MREKPRSLGGLLVLPRACPIVTAAAGTLTSFTKSELGGVQSTKEWEGEYRVVKSTVINQGFIPARIVSVARLVMLLQTFSGKQMCPFAFENRSAGHSCHTIVHDICSLLGIWAAAAVHNAGYYKR